MNLKPLSSFAGVSEQELKERLKTLTPKELKYFRVMLSKHGVLYITSKPGVAKSAIIKSIADKLQFQFFDIRLSMVDETDVGLFPKVGIMTVNGVEFDVLKHIVPEWAVMANEKPSIIFFEELNRSQLAVRNAALQILLERSIGFKFHFNDNVLMVASGNLGEEDGTDVEEFDAALNNRLIHINHMLDVNDWVDGYARNNVHPVIVSFLRNSGAAHFYKKSDADGTKAYATPRSWSFLSDYINTNYPPIHQMDEKGKYLYIKDNKQVSEEKLGEFDNKFGYSPKLLFSPVEQWIGEIGEVSIACVGASATAFIKYCNDSLKYSIKDVLDRFDKIKDDLSQANRDKNSELLAALKEIDICTLKDKNLENIKLFLLTLSDDETVGYLLHLLDNKYKLNNDSKDSNQAIIKKFMKDERLARYMKSVYTHCSDKK